MSQIAGSGKLRVSTIEDALVVPTGNQTVYRDIDGAVFDAALKPVPSTFLTRTWRHGQITAPPDIGHIKSDLIERVEHPHLYGGYFFGHFLLESLARTWALDDFGPLPIVWCAGGPPNRWQEEILQIAGVQSRLVFPDRPMRFRHLLVPEPGFRIQGDFHHTHVAHLARFQVAPRTGVAQEKVWLSRSRVTTGPQAGGEVRLEAALADFGWRILHPQERTVHEQLETLQSSGIVAGLEGSAFHAAALLKGRCAPLIVLRRTRNRNYSAIAEAKDLVEMDLFGAFSIDHRDCLDLVHPEVTAQEVDALAKEVIATGGDMAQLRAIKMRAEMRFHYEKWRHQQRWRIAPRARTRIRSMNRRYPRLNWLLARLMSRLP